MKNDGNLLQDSRLVLISNGEPYAHNFDDSGNIYQEKLPGGLTTGLDPLMQKNKGLWIAWGRGQADFEVVDDDNKVSVPEDGGYTLKRLQLSSEEVNGFYYGFSNETLWPISHSFIDKANFHSSQWDSYKKVNRKYAQSALHELKEDDLIWVHDYHLTLVPQYIKHEKPNSKIALFWHIPWPPWEIFGNVPWRQEILAGMLKSDFIGFHTGDFVRNFLECADHLENSEVNFEENIIKYQGNTTKLAAVPFGIDYDKFRKLAQDPNLDKEAQEIKENSNAQHLIFGIDRLDYTKGILKRLKAIDILLQKYPQYKGRVTLVQRVAPSRTKVKEYQKMNQNINETIGDINGRYRKHEWVPIIYFHESIPQEEIIPYCRAAEIALITPLIDGMNLVSKEYIATANNGTLILSEFAGAAEQLTEALFVNPYNTEMVADKIHEAIQMDNKERQRRLKKLQEKVKNKDVSWWKQTFLKKWMNVYE